MNTGTIQVEIWSDVMCPFCYIGKRHFEKALEQFEHRDAVQVIWRSYQLDPDAQSQPGTDIYDYLAQRKGQSREWSLRAHESVTRMAAAAGLDYRFDRVVVANSWDAHRLMHLARIKGAEKQVNEHIFRAYFTEGKDVADAETLVGIGVDAGLDENEIRLMLAGDRFAREVQQEVEEAAALGCRGVPFFVVNRQWGITGAQPPEHMLETLRAAVAE